MKKRDPRIPTIVVLEPYGQIWVWLNEEYRFQGKIEFVDFLCSGKSPTEEEYWNVALYLHNEGFIDAIERGRHPAAWRRSMKL